MATETTPNKNIITSLIEQYGIKRLENNIFEVTLNGKTYTGSLDEVLTPILGRSSWPAAPMGNPDPKSEGIFDR